MIIEGVVALCMFIGGELKEHRIQQGMSDCLKGKRVAERQLKENTKVSYKCIKSKAETEIYLGQKSIKNLILN